MHDLPLPARTLLLAAALLTGQTAAGNEPYLDYLITSPADEADAFMSQVHEGNWQAAETALQRLMEQLDGEDNAEPRRHAKLLANRGIVRAANDRPVEGLLDLEAAIAVLEKASGPFDQQLMDMLVARAMISQDVEEWEAAEDALRRAQHIAHRHSGVYTDRQLPMLDQLTNIHLARGSVLEADREQRLNLRISEHVYGEDSETLVPVLQKLGAYFARRGSTIPIQPLTSHAGRSQQEAYTEQYRSTLFKESIDLFRRAIRIIEDSYGENDLRLVEPLKGLAHARLKQKTARKFAEKAMERALRIVQNHPATDITDHARALVDLGDMYTLTSDPRADDSYLKAWNLLSGDDPRLMEVRDEIFGTPTRLHPEQLRTIAIDRLPTDVEKGDPLFANVEFSVIGNGRVAQVRILDGNVPNDEKNMLRNHLRDARFRPRIVNGVLVDTEGLTLHQTFEVVQRDPEVSAKVVTGP